jgi:hypothetical protein
MQWDTAVSVSNNIGRFESRRAQRTLLCRLRRVLVVLAALAVHPELGLLLIKGEHDGDELVLVVAIAVVTRHYNAYIADLYLGPSTFGDGVYTE